MKIKHEISKKTRQRVSKAISGKWILRLYVAGQTSKAITALKNLKSICELQLKGKYFIEVIDLLKNPKIGREEQIVAIPTLMRKLPLTGKLIIGDLSNTASVLSGLNLIGQN